MGQGFLLADPAATLFIAGVLWTMNYPLLGLVGDDAFPAYEGAHNRRFGMVVLPGVTIAAASTIELVADRAETIPL